MDVYQAEPFTAQRERMVQLQLRDRHITDQRVLDVVGDMPRERFLPSDLQPRAYEDCALPIDCGQTISQPYMVAIMTQLLRIEPTHRVLEIGTGSGYQAAILARLAGHVHTVERIDTLSRQATQRLAQLNIDNVTFHIDDGSAGWPDHSPYHSIIVTAGAPAICQNLVDQLVDGGRLVIPVGGSDEQVLTVVERRGDRTIETPSIGCRFVKLIGAAGWQADL